MSNWRTFSNPPADCPLALCDSRSVRNHGHLYNHAVVTDTVPEDFDNLPRIPENNSFHGLPGGVAYAFSYDPQHRRLYFADMIRAEIMSFKLNDSDQSVAWSVPPTLIAPTIIVVM